MDIIKYVFQETSTKKSKANMKKIPIVAKVAVKGDVDNYISSIRHETPKMYLFFNERNKFELAEVAADKCTIHLQAHDIVAALFLFIGCFFVFEVGYNKDHECFLGLLQNLMLGLPYDSAKGKAYSNFLNKFDMEYERLQDTNQFKKLCV